MNVAGVGEPGEVTEVIEVKDRTSKNKLILLMSIPAMEQYDEKMVLYASSIMCLILYY